MRRRDEIKKSQGQISKSSKDTPYSEFHHRPLPPFLMTRKPFSLLLLEILLRYRLNAVPCLIELMKPSIGERRGDSRRLNLQERDYGIKSRKWEHSHFPAFPFMHVNVP